MRWANRIQSYMGWSQPGLGNGNCRLTHAGCGPKSLTPAHTGPATAGSTDPQEQDQEGLSAPRRPPEESTQPAEHISPKP